METLVPYHEVPGLGGKAKGKGAMMAAAGRGKGKGKAMPNGKAHGRDRMAGPEVLDWQSKCGWKKPEPLQPKKAAAPQWHEHRAEPAPGAEIVPKASRVTLPVFVPNRPSAEDIDNWDDGDDEAFAGEVVSNSNNADEWWSSSIPDWWQKDAAAKAVPKTPPERPGWTETWTRPESAVDSWAGGAQVQEPEGWWPTAASQDVRPDGHVVVPPWRADSPEERPPGYYDVLQTARPKSKPKVVPALLAPPAKEAMPCEAKPVLPKCKGEPEKARPVTAKPPSPGGQAPAKGLEPPHTPRKPPEKVQKVLEKPPVKAPEKFLQKPPEKAFEKPPEKPAEKPVETEEPKQASLIIHIDEGEVKATAKEPARKVRPLPKPVAVSSAINLEDADNGKLNSGKAVPLAKSPVELKPVPAAMKAPPAAALPATPAASPAKRPSRVLPKPKVVEEKAAVDAAVSKPPFFDWVLLAKIDSILLGSESNFFVNREEDGSRIPGSKSELYESSGSEEEEEEEEDDMHESEESDEESDAVVDPVKILDEAGGPEQDDLEEEEEEEEEEDVEDDQERRVEEAAAAATTRPKAKAGRAPSGPPPPKVPPKPPPPPRREGREAKPPAQEDVPVTLVPAAERREDSGHEEEEDFNDEEMMATFAAKLQEPLEARPEGSPGQEPGPNIATRAKAKPKPKAWGAPPPLSGKKKEVEVKPEAEEEVKAEEPEKEQPPPPFFDQWLASLKFIAGWNDQKKYEASQVKEAFSQHLASEDIVSKHTVEQLCRTIVPLLLDLERVDSMVVANLKKEVLRTLKIVQVCILRIVTFELLREQAAKALRKGKGKKAEVPQEGVTYLASDITSLAKVIQHFRFDQTFTKGVHELIVSFRKQKAEKPKPAKGAAPPRKRPADSGPEPAEPPPGAGGEETQAAENGDADQASPKEDLQAAEGTDADAGEGQPSKKKPRIVS